MNFGYKSVQTKAGYAIFGISIDDSHMLQQVRSIFLKLVQQNV